MVPAPADDEDYASSPLTRWGQFWLILDAILALTDQSFDIIMMHEFAINDDLIYSLIGLGTIMAPVILTKCNYCGPVGGCIQDADSQDYILSSSSLVSTCSSLYYMLLYYLVEESRRGL